MTSLVPWLDKFDKFIDNLANETATGWPLMGSASQALLLVLTYVLIVTLVGPRLMQHRKPYKLKRIIIGYNAFQVVVCTTLFLWIFRFGPTWGCVPLSKHSAEEIQTAARISWWTMLLKMVELIETVFFVLRKKQNQISGLHVYHHGSTLTIVWGATKLFPSKFLLTPIMINCFVHMLMYTYYLLSAYGPKVQRKIFKWKRYITIVQMVQFCVLVAYTTTIMSPQCNVPNEYAYIFLPNVFLVFYMFYQFYQQAYSIKNVPGSAKTE